MGAAPSKQERSEDKQQIVDRLRALELQNRQRKMDALSSAEKGYVFVTDTDAQAPPPSYVVSASRSASREVSIAATEQWQSTLLDDPKNRLALSAFTTTSFKGLISNRAARIHDTQTFNVNIPHEGSPVTDQHSSGRCWLFASTNVFRVAFMKRYNLDQFQLSQAYLFFWDKLEKSNYYLESVIDTAHEPEDGRLFQALSAQPVGDGGQWDMVANLVSKYGLVPQAVYPDSFNAMNSSAMDGLITTKLREYALRLRALAKSSQDVSALSSAKEAMLREVHLILTLMLGAPPSPSKPFDWEYTAANGKYHKLTTTPTQFAASLSDSTAIHACSGTDVHRLFSLVHDPRNPPNTLLTVSNLGNVYGARPVTYVNVALPTLKRAAVAMLKRGLPVFFGCDVGKYSDSAAGIMDTALYDYELGFNVKLGLDKAERLRAGDSAMTHAMVLTGVQVEGDATVRWRVQNSWGPSAGDKGFFVMSDAWFNEFTFQVVVDPAFVPRDVRDVLKQKPKVLPLWDPMGALA